MATEGNSSKEQLIGLEVTKSVIAGIPANVRAQFNMDAINDLSSYIFEANCQLLSKRPCKKAFPISRSAIFTEGEFEAGKYIRFRNLPITASVVPTIIAREITYVVNANIWLKSNGDKITFHEEIPITIRAPKQVKRKSHKVDINVQGIRISMSKDLFDDESEIPIKYELERIKELKIDLVYSNKFICSCKDSNICVFNKPKPPSVVLSSVLKDPPSSGSTSIKIPDSVEPTHKWIWTEAKKSYIQNEIGDVVNYWLEITGKPYDMDEVKFQVPICILTKEEPEESEVFGTSTRKFGAVIDPKNIEISTEDVSDTDIRFKIKNKTKNSFEGLTVKVTGIKEMFFELSPLMVGKKTLNPNEDIELVYGRKKESSNYQFVIEDNNNREIVKSV